MSEFLETAKRNIGNIVEGINISSAIQLLSNAIFNIVLRLEELDNKPKYEFEHEIKEENKEFNNVQHLSIEDKEIVESQMKIIQELDTKIMDYEIVVNSQKKIIEEKNDEVEMYKTEINRLLDQSKDFRKVNNEMTSRWRKVKDIMEGRND